MRKFESSQKDESRVKSADSSKAYRKRRAFYCDWGRVCKTAVKPVQVLQNRISKFMTFTYRRSSSNNIIKIKFSKCLIYTNSICQILCTSVMPISYTLANFFENCTAFMIVAQGKKYQIFFVMSVLEKNMAKNFATCKILDLSTVSCHTNSLLWSFCDKNCTYTVF